MGYENIENIQAITIGAYSLPEWGVFSELANGHKSSNNYLRSVPGTHVKPLLVHSPQGLTTSHCLLLASNCTERRHCVW